MAVSRAWAPSEVKTKAQNIGHAYRYSVSNTADNPHDTWETEQYTRMTSYPPWTLRSHPTELELDHARSP